MKLSDMNRINDLIEKGFVQTQSGRQISLHPMIQEVAIDETRPSVNNSAVLLDSLQTICLLHGHDVTWYKPLFLTIENIIREIADDNTPAYLSFLEDVFPYMEKYHYTAGMELIIGKLSGLLTDETVGRSTDRAVLLDYRAACEEKTEKAIKLEKEAIALIPEALDLAAMGILPEGMYRNRAFAEESVDPGETELAKQDMLYDPQTSGGLLMAVDPGDADALFAELRGAVPAAQRIGTVEAYRGGKRIFLH